MTWVVELLNATVLEELEASPYGHEGSFSPPRGCPIEARTRAGLTQEQLARRMKTTQAVIARLEGGGTKPSNRTLERYTKATSSRLRITFEPERART